MDRLYSIRIALLSALVVCTLSLVHGETFSISTPQGPVFGVREGDMVVFRGIPYAAPPVGPLRWKSPQPPAAWTEPLNATAWKSRCMQPGGGSEDCLYANVWAPYPLPKEPLPVYAYIYGAGFVGGIPSQWPGGGFLAGSRNKMVFVNFAYRGGPWGFLAYPAFSAEKGVGNIASSGNYGFEDQVQALRWIRDNIGAYGGNPNMVTIGGESAGAISCCLHLVSAPSRGLFHQAILQSGGCDVLRTLAEAEVVGANIINHIAAVPGLEACNGTQGTQAALDCLRSPALTNEIILERTTAAGGFDYFHNGALAANADGVNFLDFPANIFKTDRSNPASILLGSNTEEMGLFLKPFDQGSFYPDPITNSTISDYAWGLSKNDPKIQQFYNSALSRGQYPSAYRVFSNMLSKCQFQCPSLRVARHYERTGNKVFYYQFNYTSPLGDSYVAYTAGAMHAMELSYIFRVPSQLYNWAPLPSTDAAWNFTADEKMSNVMRNYWLKFIISADVNGAPLSGIPSDTPAPNWSRFTQNTTDAMFFQYDGSLRMIQNIYEECDMWDRIIHADPLVARLVTAADWIPPPSHTGGVVPSSTPEHILAQVVVILTTLTLSYVAIDSWKQETKKV